MRRITLWFMTTVTLLVLLFSYHTSTESVAASEKVATPKTTSTPSESAASPSPADIPSTTSDDAAPSAAAPSAAAAAPTASAPATATGTLKDGTYTGTSVDTRWGPVQVKIVVSGGKITSSDAVVYPVENHKDIEINQVAVPTLNEEAIAAQSAAIDAVSGASYTSYGYITSLQSALDKAAA